MCRRNRSRPSSKRRLTKKLKHLSSGRSVCAKAIGVLDEHRFRTKGPAAAARGADSPVVEPDVDPAANSGCDVIASPELFQSLITSPAYGTLGFCGADGSASVALLAARSWQPRRH